MKLKKKHFEFVQTIEAFVEKCEYPNFTTATRDEIDMFMTIESCGVKGLSEKQRAIYDDPSSNIDALFNGRANYDLQIKMIHDEIGDWLSHGWGWWYPMNSIFNGVWKDRHKCKYYVKALIKMIRNMKDTSGIQVMMKYTGFSDEQKQKIYNGYFSAVKTRVS
jgi:hypothetical protein